MLVDIALFVVKNKKNKDLVHENNLITGDRRYRLES